MHVIINRQINQLFALIICIIFLTLSHSALAKAAIPDTVVSNTTFIFASSEYPPHYGPLLPQQGVVIDIVRRAFAKRNIRIEVAFMPFARALHDTQQGQYSGIIAIWHTAERTKHFWFSDCIYANRIVLFKRANEFNETSNLSELLDGQGTLGLVTGYAQAELLQNSRFNKVSVATDGQVFSMLALKRVDLVPADLQNGLYHISKLPAEQKKVPLDWLAPTLEHKPMYLAFPKIRPDSLFLQQEFNLGLQALTDSGELTQILTTMPASY